MILHLGTSNIILKVSKKNRKEKQGLFWLRKGEKNTRKEWERYGGKGKRKERTSWNKRSSQWLIQYIIIIYIVWAIADYVYFNLFLPFSFPSISLSLFPCMSLSFAQFKLLLFLLVIFKIMYIIIYKIIYKIMYIIMYKIMYRGTRGNMGTLVPFQLQYPFALPNI